MKVLVISFAPVESRFHKQKQSVCICGSASATLTVCIQIIKDLSLLPNCKYLRYQVLNDTLYREILCISLLSTKLRFEDHVYRETAFACI